MLGKKQYIVVHHLIAGCTRKQVFFQGLQFLHTLEPHTLLLSSHALKTSKGPQKRAVRGCAGLHETTTQTQALYLLLFTKANNFYVKSLPSPCKRC